MNGNIPLLHCMPNDSYTLHVGCACFR